MKKFLATIAGASLLLSVTGIVSKGLGFLREVVIANYYGLGVEFDVYLVSISIPTVLGTTIFYFGQNFFVPYFNDKLAEGNSAEEIFNHNFWKIKLFGWIIYFILFIITNPLLKLFLPGSDPEQLTLAVNLFRIYSISIPLFSSVSIFTAYHHCNKNFLIPAVSQLLMNLSLIMVLLLFAPVAGIYAIPVAVILALILQLQYLVFYSGRILKIKYILQLFSRSGIRLEKRLLLTAIAELLSLSYIIIDRAFFNEVESGGISALNYATTLYNLPLAIFSFALASAVFPSFSSDYYNNKIKALAERFDNAINISLFIFIPTGVIIYSQGHFFVNLIFERGAFTAEGTVLTSEVLKIYTPALISLGILGINNKFMYSTGMVKQYAFLLLGALLVKSILSYFLVELYQQNGLAAATSVTLVLLATISSVIITRRMKNISGIKTFNTIVLYLVIGIFARILSGLSLWLIGLQDIYANIGEIFLISLIYILFLIFADIKEIKIIKKLFRPII